MGGVPDLKDSSGRLQRGIISLAVGIACAVATYFIATAVIQPDSEAHAAHVASRQMSGGSFVLWISGLAFCIAIWLAHGIQGNIARKKWAAKPFS
jgi:hypothetical protein